MTATTGARGVLNSTSFLRVEVEIARLVVLFLGGQHQVAEALGELVALGRIGEPIAPLAVGAGLAWQHVLDGHVLDVEMLRAAGDMIVETQKHQLGERRTALVQIAQIVMDGAQLLPRQVERAGRAREILCHCGSHARPS